MVSGELILLLNRISPANRAFTRANYLAFDIAPQLFDWAVEVLKQNQVPIDLGWVSRPTGRGVYFYDPDGFLIEIRCETEEN